jgi:hypothetical protein
MFDHFDEVVAKRIQEEAKGLEPIKKQFQTMKDEPAMDMGSLKHSKTAKLIDGEFEKPKIA